MGWMDGVLHSSVGFMNTRQLLSSSVFISSGVMFKAPGSLSLNKLRSKFNSTYLISLDILQETYLEKHEP